MEEAIIYKWTTYVLPVITSVVSWFLGRRARNNSTLQQMQSSIDLLVQKNAELYQKVIDQNAQLVDLRRENYELKARVTHTNETIVALKSEIETLRKKLKG
ncbi:MAG: hypothetical protein ACI30H_02625 [Paludibacteraceae bacterium]